jgi:hypothetical protein
MTTTDKRDPLSHSNAPLELSSDRASIADADAILTIVAEGKRQLVALEAAQARELEAAKIAAARSTRRTSWVMAIAGAVVLMGSAALVMNFATHRATNIAADDIASVDPQAERDAFIPTMATPMVVSNPEPGVATAAPKMIVSQGPKLTGRESSNTRTKPCDPNDHDPMNECISVSAH